MKPQKERRNLSLAELRRLAVIAGVLYSLFHAANEFFDLAIKIFAYWSF